MFTVVVDQNQQLQRASSNAPTILFENMARKTSSMAFTFSQCAGCKQENFMHVTNRGRKRERAILAYDNFSHTGHVLNECNEW